MSLPQISSFMLCLPAPSVRASPVFASRVFKFEGEAMQVKVKQCEAVQGTVLDMFFAKAPRKPGQIKTLLGPSRYEVRTIPAFGLVSCISREQTAVYLSDQPESSL